MRADVKNFTRKDWEDSGLLYGLSSAPKENILTSFFDVQQHPIPKELEEVIFPIVRRVWSRLETDSDNLIFSLRNEELRNKVQALFDGKELIEYATIIWNKFLGDPSFMKYHNELDWHAEICMLIGNGYAMYLLKKYRKLQGDPDNQVTWLDRYNSLAGIIDNIKTEIKNKNNATEKY